jgi:hypothetical protein
VIPNDKPWSGLEAGKTDTRRVDAAARWNWFWAVMPRADVALVLQLKQLPNPLPDLPNLKSLEIRFQTLPGGPIFYIRLKDNSQMELFETLCRDVKATGEIAESESDALSRAISRTFRWHHLLRGGKLDVLTEDEQKGLIGELEFFKLLMAAIGAKAALAAWKGPSGAPKDFELEAHCVEVKARRGASQPFVNVTSEHQLTDVPGRRLWLGVLAVDRVQPPNGRTLSELVAEVTEALERTAPSLIREWDLLLADAGFDVTHDYSAWRWVASTIEYHEVAEGFPRIDAPVPLGVSGVKYALALSACAPFRTEWHELLSLIKGAQE